jgi:hypothetical protein
MAKVEPTIAPGATRRKLVESKGLLRTRSTGDSTRLAGPTDA